MKKNLWLPYNPFTYRPDMRLFCFHHCGGVASMFIGWRQVFPSSIEICPVQLPGREARFKDGFITSMPCLIEELTRCLGPYFDVPFLFFGHSLGSVIAFELTRRLRQNGLKPELLCISACPYAKIANYGPLIHQASDEQLIEELKAYGAMPQKILENAEMIHMLLPRMRADFQLFETYQYQEQPPLDTGIIAFGGTEDPMIQPEHLYAWKKETVSKFRLQLFSGGHFYLESQCKQICDTIALFLPFHSQ